MIIPSHSFGVVASGRPRAAAAATGFGAGDLAFNDITTPFGGAFAYGNVVTATKSGTIFIVQTNPSLNAEHYAYFTKNGVGITFRYLTNETPMMGFYNSGETASVNVNAGDTLQWYANQSGAPIGADSMIIAIKNSDSSGVTIDTLTISRV